VPAAQGRKPVGHRAEGLPVRGRHSDDDVRDAAEAVAVAIEEQGEQHGEIQRAFAPLGFGSGVLVAA